MDSVNLIIHTAVLMTYVHMYANRVCRFLIQILAYDLDRQNKRPMALAFCLSCY